MNCEWQKLLREFESAKHFIDSLGFLAFGKDMGIIRSACGIQPVHTNQILQSAAQTIQSMIACAEYGNIADVHVLLRKLRDDLFFYLYVIVACRNNDILSEDNLSKQETYINAWIKNRLSRLNISEVIKDITNGWEIGHSADKAGSLLGMTLKLTHLRCCGKGAEGGDGVLQIQHLCVGIVFVIHGAEIAVFIQHGLLGFNAVIFHKLCCHTQPHTVLEGAELALGICSKLLGDGLDFAGLDVQLPLENVSGAEGTDAGLIAFHGGKIIDTCGFQKFTYFFHQENPPFKFDCLST